MTTIGNIKENYNEWLAAGGEKETAKFHMNCIHPPIFDGEEDTLILQIIPPPELHLLLGVVNGLFDHID